ncbi:hypothetical protein ACMD2_25021 [Ananas comosus]|uniref:Uncharacterized protein n=1 Tax=Ananas comosus TaxID=4615 RepID=A0A199VX54_ANACO|nr:hypothetical protein ACMD2_25021 [Ananas comosus]
MIMVKKLSRLYPLVQRLRRVIPTRQLAL